ncbi:hypothetical protein VSR34_30820 [Paraburkholderia sp. JHI2823]|uniref:hypothetical protein n=1 Tax=Paraburkholderia sp. JHI2823 TaxID=3112960 RepID=UPI0031711599
MGDPFEDINADEPAVPATASGELRKVHVNRFLDGVKDEKPVDQKKPVPQYVVERRKQGGRLSKRSCIGSGKTRNQRFSDRGADAPEGEKEAIATLMPGSCADVCARHLRPASVKRIGSCVPSRFFGAPAGACMKRFVKADVA